jgi:hypothetical protein
MPLVRCLGVAGVARLLNPFQRSRFADQGGGGLGVAGGGQGWCHTDRAKVISGCRGRLQSSWLQWSGGQGDGIAAASTAYP